VNVYRPLPILLAATLMALPACTSSGSTDGSTPASRTGTSSSSGGTAATLSAAVQKGIADVTSAQLSVQATLLSQHVDAAGPATFSGGTLTAADLSGTVAGVGRIRAIYTHGKAYAQVPAGLNSSGKPWLAVSADSANQVASQLGGALDGIQGAASPKNLVTFIAAAKTVTDEGHATVAGTSATHYRLVVDGSKLPAGFPGKDDYSGTLAGSATDLWVDAQGRPVKVSRQAVVQGAKVPITILASGFNRPVSITAPPAAQVATG
jgi:hypothetical protein